MCDSKRSTRPANGTRPSRWIAGSIGTRAATGCPGQAQIAALPEELSSVLLVVSVEGYSYAEAAELFDIPAGTVMSRIHRARKLLAERLATEEQGVS